MEAVLSLWYALALAIAQPVDTKFVQVHPELKNPPLWHGLPTVARSGDRATTGGLPTVPRSGDRARTGSFVRSVGQTRAVVLIHGLSPHPFSNRNVHVAGLRGWQEPGSFLVKKLGEQADVFAFAYGQTMPVTTLVDSLGFLLWVCRLRELGYGDIVLVGHSTGGLIARHFVENYPQAGVTKVIQVCPPNGGAIIAKATIGVRSNQEEFLQSLGKRTREQYLKRRGDKRIPEAVQFVCVVGTGMVWGDGLVSCRCQWTEDLQRQGVPAIALRKNHSSVISGKRGATKIAELVGQDQPRWDAVRVAAARKEILGDGESKGEPAEPPTPP